MRNIWTVPQTRNIWTVPQIFLIGDVPRCSLSEGAVPDEKHLEEHLGRPLGDPGVWYHEAQAVVSCVEV